jgi:2-polyprenyl-6-methoxyphenol hydroxylase-like FAD-dependent oxidoreductase
MAEHARIVVAGGGAVGFGVAFQLAEAGIGDVLVLEKELFAMIDSYLKVLADLGAELPAGYRDVVREAGAVRAALAPGIGRWHPATAIPCASDFWAYALNRFKRCKALMATPGFGAHLAAVSRSRAGP